MSHIKLDLGFQPGQATSILVRTLLPENCKNSFIVLRLTGINSLAGLFTIGLRTGGGSLRGAGLAGDGASGWLGDAGGAPGDGGGDLCGRRKGFGATCRIAHGLSSGWLEDPPGI